MNTKIPTMEELLEAGVHFGHQVRRGNPKMKKYIYGERDGVHILDLAQSEEKLKEATQAAFELGKSGKILLLVGTKKQARELVEGLAKEFDMPYLSSKWVGGFLTNFEELRKQTKKLNDLKAEKEKGDLSRYTKKEQLLIARKLEKFEKVLGGVAHLEKIPDAMFIIDAPSEMTAVREGLRVGIPMLGFADTNADPTLLDFPIPANDDGIKAITLVTETVIRAYGEGKKNGIRNEEERVSKEAAQAAKDKKKEEKEAGSGGVEEDEAVMEEAAVIEEQVEQQVVDESNRKEG